MLHRHDPRFLTPLSGSSRNHSAGLSGGVQSQYHICQKQGIIGKTQEHCFPFDSAKHSRWIFPLSLLFCSSWSLPSGAEAAAFSWHFMYVFYAKFWEPWEEQAIEMWTVVANSISIKELHATGMLLLVVFKLYSLAFTLQTTEVF